jgi:glycosyltransferase involved in cell wall biosynthesis
LDLPAFEHPHTFLRERFVERLGRDPVHNNIDILGALRAFRPHVVMTNGFNPTHLYAFVYAQFTRAAHVAMTDGTLASEGHLSRLHRMARQLVFGRSGALVAASRGGRELLQSFGAAPDKIFFSPLCANAAVDWEGVVPRTPPSDFLFSGRLIDIKNPLFALQVAQAVSQRIGRRVSLAVLGSGPLETELRTEAERLATQVDVRLAGHVSQTEIPSWFTSAGVFLFPSSWDPWGVVANEAGAAGVPVIVSPHAGVADDLIRDGINGFVRPLDLPAWTDAAAALLTNPGLRAEMAAQARQRVLPYSAEVAARGLVDAARRAAGRSLPGLAVPAASWPN